jgi:hypothetical protein
MSDSLAVSAQTRINAPLGKAWQVLTDFGSYHTWHPILTLQSHAGPLAVGTVLQGLSSGGPAGEQHVVFTIAEVQEPNYLAWTGGDPAVVAGRHFFQLEQLADGTTEFIESEVFTGPAAPAVIGVQLPQLHTRTRRSPRHPRSASKAGSADDANGRIRVGGCSVRRGVRTPPMARP